MLALDQYKALLGELLSQTYSGSEPGKGHLALLVIDHVMYSLAWCLTKITLGAGEVNSRQSARLACGDPEFHSLVCRSIKGGKSTTMPPFMVPGLK